MQFTSDEHDGTVQLCYDGDAFRHVLALPATAAMQARAALVLTRPECIDPALPPLQRQQRDLWRAEVLDRVDAGAYATLDEVAKNRLQMRRAGVWSAIAFQRARRARMQCPPASARSMR